MNCICNIVKRQKSNLLVTICLTLGIAGCTNDIDDSIISLSQEFNHTKLEGKDEAPLILCPEDIDYLSIIDKGILDEMTVQERLKAVMVYKLADNISLIDSVYSFDITQEEAEKIGVSKEIYSECFQNISDINKIIESTKNIPNNELCLTDFKELVKNKRNLAQNKLVQCTTRSHPQSGIISAIDNDWHYGAFYPSIFHNKVLFVCFSNAAPFAVYTCSVKQVNNVHTGMKTGILYQYVGITLYLFLSGSGTTAELGFKTTDSNGGWANWRAIDDYGNTHE